MQDIIPRREERVARLHYNLHPQGKLMRGAGRRDLRRAVDIRSHSPTCGQWARTFSPPTTRIRCVPTGFATDSWCSRTMPSSLQDDRLLRGPSKSGASLVTPQMGIHWQLGDPPQLSAKDAKGVPYAESALFP